MAEIVSLKQQRASAKGNITRMKNLLSNATASWNTIDLECRLDILNSYIKQLMAYQTEIEKLDPTDDRRGEIEELCVSAKSQLLQLLGGNRRRPSAVLENTLGVPMPPYNRLPNLKLPKFDGKYSDYKNFIGTFDSLVHDEFTLSPIEKFNHLLSCLSGDALRTVKSFQISPENYTKARDLLAERYDKKCLIFFDNIESIFNIPHMQKADAASLRVAVDTISAIYDSLLSLGDDKEITNALLIQLLLSKVDSGSRARWNDQLDYSKLPTWKDCSKVMIRRCQSLEVNDCSVNKNEPSIKSRYNGNKPRASLSVATESSCVCCNSSGHSLNTCQQFNAWTVQKRFELVKTQKLCLNCLRKGHMASNCRSARCRLCNLPHHLLLHKQTSSNVLHEPSTSAKSQSSLPSSAQDSQYALRASIEGEMVLLATAIVMIKNKFNKFQPVRALLDSGSQVNCITAETANRLKLKQRRQNTQLVGVGESRTNINHRVDTVVHSRLTKYKCEAEFLVMKTIAGYQPADNLQIQSWNIPSEVELADPNFHKKQRLDMLIGAELFFDLLTDGKIKLGEALPTLQKTQLGWIVSGTYKPNQAVSAFARVGQLSKTSESNIEETLKKFWEVEEVKDMSPQYSEEQQMCERHFAENTRLLPVGRYEVRLPFKTNPAKLGASFEVARRRFLALERRLAKTPNIQSMYMDFMEEYLALGHMSLVGGDVSQQAHYFIPHQVVMRPESETTKLRVVFDASSKTSTQLSLNETLRVGPTIQADLYTLLIRFRCHRYALTADITKMYRQILVHKDDRLFQLILWRKSPESPIEVYQLNTVTYGTAPAPFLAIRCLKEIGKRFENKLSIGSRTVQEDFYVDDMLTGAETVEGLQQVRDEVTQILDAAGFKLAKWKTNLVNHAEQTDVSLQALDSEYTKALGVVWQPQQDVLSYRLVAEFEDLRPTKRNILSAASRLFDPLGLVCPVITRAKILLQELWLQKLEWDETITPHLGQVWSSIKENLRHISKVSVPRYVSCFSTAQVQVHGFADASMRAYGFCVYIRSETKNGVVTTLLTAKSKVAPIKTKSLPRLELCAAYLLSKWWKLHAATLPPVNEVFFWSDSEITLFWLKKHPAVLATFVSNRVAEIQDWTANVKWRHVPTKENPADLVSRGCSVDELINSIWFNGPVFLSKPASVWPISTKPQLRNEKQLELRQAKLVFVNQASEPNLVDELCDKFSSYRTLIRVMSYICRFAYSKTEKVEDLIVSSKEIEHAFLKIVEIIQQTEYVAEIEALRNGTTIKAACIQKLTPFLQPYTVELRTISLIRVGGRLCKSPLPYEAKFPLLLPAKCKFVSLYVQHLHITNCHAGAKVLVGLLRQKIWAINAREIARKVVRSCVHCFRYKPILMKQIMGDLPADRVTPARPFSISGVDFCGPIYTTMKIRGRPPYKSYVAVFICFATKAVHLEPVSDLSTDAFLLTFKRFIGRRGLPAKIYCDNGTNFVGANTALQDLKARFLSAETTTAVQRMAAERGVEFIFIPPRAPHFGGLWEAAVKAAKRLLIRTIANAGLTFEELCTVLVDVEAILNSRPIAPTEDPNDGEALTPAHFIIGSSLQEIPGGNIHARGCAPLKRWQHICSLKEQLWSSYQKDYILGLQDRAKWRTPSRNITEGALVLVHDDAMPPQCWTLGRIVAAIQGTDGQVRVADIKTAGGIIRRPIAKLALIPAD